MAVECLTSILICATTGKHRHLQTILKILLQTVNARQCAQQKGKFIKEAINFILKCKKLTNANQMKNVPVIDNNESSFFT